jgi:antitoxin component of MazEF toxin-antitoxin module
MASVTQIAKWGNSLGLRLPKSVAIEAQVGEGDTVNVSVKNGAIVIRPNAIFSWCLSRRNLCGCCSRF